MPTTTPAAAPDTARAHFEGRLAVETDCADVGAALAAGGHRFVVLDVRSAEAFAHGHLPGAISLPSAEISAARLDDLGPTDLYITYCWGPHCNGATRGAAAVARLGRPVKEMIGGVWGWEREGFELVVGAPSAA